MGGLLSGLLTQATSGLAANEEGKQQGTKMLRDILMNNLKMEGERATIGKTLADTLHTQHQNQAPVLGEPNYAKAKGDEAGAVEAAQTPALVDRATRMIQPHVQQIRAETPAVAAQAGAKASAEVAPHVRQAGGEAAVQQPFKKEMAGVEGAIHDTNATNEQNRAFANAAGLDALKESGSIVAPVMRKITGRQILPVNPAQAPSAQKPIKNPSLPPLTPAQAARAATDPQYKQFLAAKGYR